MTTPSDHSKNPAPDPKKPAPHGPDDALSHDLPAPKPEDSSVDLGQPVGKGGPDSGAGSSGGISVVDWASLVEDEPPPPSAPPSFDAPSDFDIIFPGSAGGAARTMIAPTAESSEPPAAPEGPASAEEPEASTLADVHLPPEARHEAIVHAEAGHAPTEAPGSSPKLTEGEAAFIEENSVVAAPPSSGSISANVDFIPEHTEATRPPSGPSLAAVDYSEEQAAAPPSGHGPAAPPTPPPTPAPRERKSVFEKAEAEAAAFAAPEEVVEDTEFSPEKMFDDAPVSPPSLPPMPKMELDSGRRLDDVVELAPDAVVRGSSSVPDTSGITADADDDALVAEVAESSGDSAVMAEIAEVEDVEADEADETEMTHLASHADDEVAEVAEVAEDDDEVLELGAEAVAGESAVNLSAIEAEVSDSAVGVPPPAPESDIVVADHESGSRVGREPAAQDPGASGRDLIAEAVESGVDGPLVMPGMDLAEGRPGDSRKGKKAGGKRAQEPTREMTAPPPPPESEDYFDPAESAIPSEGGDVPLGAEPEVVAESSSIDLGSMPEMPILPSAPAGSSEVADIDLEALQGASSSQRAAGKADAEGEIDLGPPSASPSGAPISGASGEVISEEAVVEGEEEESFATVEERAGEGEVDYEEVAETADVGHEAVMDEEGAVEEAAVMDEEVPAEEAAVMDENLLDEETGFGEEEPVAEEEEEERPRGKKGKPEVKAKGRGGAWVGGTVLGTLIGAGACVGLLVSGHAPQQLKDLVGVKDTKGNPTPPPQNNKGGNTVASASPDHLIAEGKFDQAREAVQNFADNEKKELHLARIDFTKAAFDQVSKTPDGKLPVIKGDDPAIQAVITKLETVKTADGYFEMGLIYEEVGNWAKAKESYDEGLKKAGTDDEKARFNNALRNLERRQKAAAAGAVGFLHRPGMRLDNAEAAMIALLLVTLQPPGDNADAGNAAKAKEAGYKFYDALQAADNAKAAKDPTMAALEYKKAIDTLQEAAALHARNRLLRRGLQQNPHSDPREQIFLDCVEELKAFWALREKLARDHQIVEADLAKGIKDAITKGAGGVPKELTEKLVKEKIIDKPEDFDKAVNQLIDQRKALVEKLDIKDVDAFFKDKGGLDQLADTKKVLDDVVKAVKADKPEDVKTKVEDLVKDNTLLKKVGDKLKEDKVIEKFENRDDLEAGVTALVTDWKTIPGLKKDLADTKKELTDAQDFVNKLFGVLVKAEVFKEGDKQPETKIVLGAAENVILMAKGKKEIVEVVRANSELTMKNAELTGQLTASEKKRVDELAELDKKRVDQLAEKDKKHKEETEDAEKKQMAVTEALRAKLAASRTPEQMLPLWLPLLEVRDRHKEFTAETAKAAKADAERVLADPEKKKADEARAKAVLGLALRNAGKYADALALLDESEKQLEKDNAWLLAVAEARLECKDVVAYYRKQVDEHADHNYPDKAVNLIDRMLAGATDEQKGLLLAQRSLLRLEMAMAGGKTVEFKDPLVENAIKDAKEAGDIALAHYALGRVFEELRKPDDALAEFTKAVNLHKAEDADSFRFRAARDRALTAPRVGPRPPIEVKPADDKVGRRARDEDADAVALSASEEERLALVLLTVMLEPPCPFPPPAFPVDADAPAAGAAKATPEEEAARVDAEKILSDPKAPVEARVEALLILGRSRDALKLYTEWLRKENKMRAPYAQTLKRIIEANRCLARPDTTPNPLVAENYWGNGLRAFFAGRYAEAEEQFLAAVDADEEDARYFYFLGLSQLAQGKQKDAKENFAEGAAVERKNGSRVAVNASLERVQGSLRRILDEERNRVPVP
jgi:tetratricopeptide (TPR) repeat protein